MAEYWTTGTFGCFEDFVGCLYGWCCPGCQERETFARLQSRQPGCAETCCISPCCGCCVVPAAVYMDRTWIRERYHIPQDPDRDCLLVCLCISCTVCQNAREVTIRERSSHKRHFTSLMSTPTMVVPGVLTYPTYGESTGMGWQDEEEEEA
mmetsp:Transcript_40788/g.66149  ORF Transcript_40788/g.66149 Transcript_40788/m.66149 type:complete len:151 (-) Transcript_40788:212-664(-)